MSTQNFSQRLTQALATLSNLNCSDDDLEGSPPASGPKGHFSDRLQSLLSQFPDSPDSSDSESAFLDNPQFTSLLRQRKGPKDMNKILQTLSKVASTKRVTTKHMWKQKPKVHSSEEPSSLETPEDSLERTEEEFVPESLEITYQFMDEGENQELEQFDPVGEQLLLNPQYLGSQSMEKDQLLADPASWMMAIEEIQYLKPGLWLRNNSIDLYLLQHWLKGQDQSPVLYLNTYHIVVCSRSESPSHEEYQTIRRQLLLPEGGVVPM